MKYYTVKTMKIDLVEGYLRKYSSQNKTYIHIFKDITSHEKLKAEKDYRQYQTLMLSSVAHEFRNPLNSVSGNLELINLVTKEEKIKEFALKAKNSCLMINSYVEDILDLGRFQKGVFHLKP